MGEVKVALQWAAVVCLLFAMSWVIRSGKDRIRGILMGFAFTLMAGVMWGYGSGWPDLVVLGMLGLVFVCLVGDFLVRAARKGVES